MVAVHPDFFYEEFALESSAARTALAGALACRESGLLPQNYSRWYCSSWSLGSVVYSSTSPALFQYLVTV